MADKDIKALEEETGGLFREYPDESTLGLGLHGGADSNGRVILKKRRPEKPPGQEKIARERWFD